MFITFIGVFCRTAHYDVRSWDEAIERMHRPDEDALASGRCQAKLNALLMEIHNAKILVSLASYQPHHGEEAEALAELIAIEAATLRWEIFRAALAVCTCHLLKLVPKATVMRYIAESREKYLDVISTASNLLTLESPSQRLKFEAVV
jgi:hypothetical protein